MLCEAWGPGHSCGLRTSQFWFCEPTEEFTDSPVGQSYLHLVKRRLSICCLNFYSISVQNQPSDKSEWHLSISGWQSLILWMISFIIFLLNCPSQPLNYLCISHLLCVLPCRHYIFHYCHTDYKWRKMYMLEWKLQWRTSGEYKNVNCLKYMWTYHKVFKDIFINWPKPFTKFSIIVS